MKKLFSFLGALAAGVIFLASATGVEAKGFRSMHRGTSWRNIPSTRMMHTRNTAPFQKPFEKPFEKPTYQPSYQPDYAPTYKPDYIPAYYPPVAPPVYYPPVYQPVPPVVAPFSCGPSLDTYVVHSLDTRQGLGVRCVKWNDTQTSAQPAFSWYGEGSWNGCTYRHVGQAISNAYTANGSDYQGYSSDIMGNGECGNATYPGNLQINAYDRNTIRVTGAWNEEWTRVSTVDYTPLPAPKTCGAYFQQYHVMSTPSYEQTRAQGYTNDTSTGLRCVLTVGPAFSTWYGVGNWSGQSYSHLGTSSSQGYGANDLCRPGEICNVAQPGSLWFKQTPNGDGYCVNGWNEVWLKQ
jgi:hypothetical protein